MADQCHYCSRETFPSGAHQVKADRGRAKTRDHDPPKSLYKFPGQHGHTVVCCSRCNNLKGDTPADVFEFFILKTGAKTEADLSLEFRRFRYQLMRAGFICARALHIAGAGNVDSKNKAVLQSTPRDNRGRFTLADLRKKGRV